MDLREAYNHPAQLPISLRHLGGFLLFLESKIMSALDDLNAKADQLTAQAALNHAAIQDLIALAKAKGASDDEIAAVTAKLDGALSTITADDAAAAGTQPAAAAAPAGDPVPDPVPDSGVGTGGTGTP